MPNYLFSFPAAAAGLPVSITDASGTVVATDTLGPADEVQGAVRMSARLLAGEHVATATDPAIFASFRAPGVLDILGSTLSLPGTELTFEVNAGSVLASGASEPIAFTTVPDGYEPGTTFNLPDGLYLTSVEIYFNEPAEPRYLNVNVSGNGDYGVTQGPFIVTPVGDGLGTYQTAQFVFANFLLLRTGEDTVRVMVSTTHADDLVDPADMTFFYARARFTKIA